MHALRFILLITLLGCTRLDHRCVSEEQPVEIRGTSLLGLMPPGSSAKLLLNAYACNEPRRGDIVVHRFAGNRDPVVKILAAVPGDTFSIDDCPPDDVLPRRCLILRGKTSRTSEGTTYLLQPKEEALLGEYVRSNAGVIPPSTYLLLSNRQSGTVDSRQFGLVSRADLLGPLQR